MSGPTYDVASPGIGGAISDAVNAVRKEMARPHMESASLMNKKVEDAETGTDDASSDHSSDQPSNAGKQAQSSDHWNSY